MRFGSCLATALSTLFFRSLGTDHLSIKIHSSEAKMVGLVFARMCDSTRAVGFRLAVFSALGTSHVTVQVHPRVTDLGCAVSTRLETSTATSRNRFEISLKSTSL